MAPNFDRDGARIEALFIAGAWTFLAWPWLFDGRIIPYDALDQFFPAAAFVANSLRAGDTPFWNPWVFMGYPQFADPQGMTFSPGIVLPMMASPTLTMFQWAVMLHLLVGGLGVARLGRLWGWSTGAIVIAAAVFMFGGQASSRLQHVPMILSYALFPWVITGLIKACSPNSRWRDTFVLGVAGGMLGLQLTQVTHLLAVLAVAFGAFLIVEKAKQQGLMAVRRPILMLVAASLLAFVIATPQIVATLSFLEFTARQRFDYATASAFSMRPFNFLTLIAPNVLGSLQGTYVGTSDVTESYAFIGLVPLSVVIAFLFHRVAWRNRVVWFWLAVLVAGFAFCMGHFTPFHRLAFDWIPGSQLFRRPSDGAFLMVIAWSCLVGFGWTTVTQTGEARNGRMRLLAAIACSLTAAGVALSFVFGTLPRFQSTLSVLAICIALVAVALQRVRLASAAVAIVLLALLDLRVANSANRHNGQQAVHWQHAANLASNPAAESLSIHLRADLPAQYRAGFINYYNANSAMLFKLPIANGYNPLLIREVQVTEGGNAGAFEPRTPFGGTVTYADATARLAGIRYLAVPASVEVKYQSVLSTLVRQEEIGKRAEYGWVIYRNDSALPRWFSPITVRSAPVQRLLDDNDFAILDVPSTAFVATDEATIKRCGTTAVTASLVEGRNGTLTFDVHSVGGGWLIINDAYLPWWSAHVESARVPVYRANGAFRGVCVPEGRTKLTMSFDPWRGMVEQWRARSASLGQ